MADDKKSTDNNTDKSNKKGPPPLPLRGFAIAILMLAAFMAVVQLVGGEAQGKNSELDYTSFIELVKQDRVSKVVMSNDGAGNNFAIVDTLDQDENGNTQHKVHIPFRDDTTLQELLDTHGVHVSAKAPKTVLISLLWNVIPFIVIFAIIYVVFIRQMKNAGRGAMSFGKSRAKLLTQDKNKITFKEVAGVDEAKEELQEVVEFLKDPKQFQKLGGKMPKGVLLSGSPGTGKTLLAKAVAGEADVPFFTISGSDFVEMFVGIGASRVRDMFEQGKKNAPCIIFIDEIDAVGRSRFSGIGGGHDEREQTLNALLVEMDGFDTQEGIIIVAATNRPDVLDPALLRPGRFDRQVVVDLPTLEGREHILKIHSRNVRLSDKVDLKKAARGTPGFSGADLANLVNEAALLASRRGADFVEQEDMEEARDKVMWGRERRSHVLDPEEKKLTAYHEAGHAVATYFTPGHDPIHKVTIIPRGRALGATMYLPEKDRYTQSQTRIEANLVSIMGGRAAEELIFEEVTTGAHNDIERATAMARAMVCEYGMSQALGPQNLSNNSQPIFMGQGMSGGAEYSEHTAQMIDRETHRILTEAYDKCMKILLDHKEQLVTLSETLIEREVLDFSEVDSIMKTGKLPPEAEHPAIEQQSESTPKDTATPEAIPDAVATTESGSENTQATETPAATEATEATEVTETTPPDSEEPKDA